MGCRGADERDTFPVTETIHREEILRESVAPARASKAVRERARDVAHDVLDVMDGRGVFGIELFETTDGEILLNEIAPRPHNSGHWTIEGCTPRSLSNTSALSPASRWGRPTAVPHCVDQHPRGCLRAPAGGATGRGQSCLGRRGHTCTGTASAKCTASGRWGT